MMVQKGLLAELSVDAIEVVEGWNTRETFDAADLLSLGKTMESAGLQQPIAVNRVNDTYQLIYGERRLRAAREAGLETILCMVHESVPVKEAVLMRSVENIQRCPLNVIETAQEYRQMVESGYAVADVADVAGVSDDTVRNYLRLTDLPREVQRMMVRKENKLPIHQALQLCNLSGEKAIEVARKIAPMTGPVASEERVREVVDEIINGPKFHAVENTPKTGGGQVLSNIKHDPDADGVGVPLDGEDGWPAINEEMPVSEITEIGHLKTFAEYQIPVYSKSIKACVMYGRKSENIWSWGFRLLCPGLNVSNIPANTSTFDSSAREAVICGLMAIISELDNGRESATSKTLKKDISAVIEKIGKRIAFLRGDSEEPLSPSQPSPSIAAPVRTVLQKNIKLAKSMKPVDCTVTFSGPLSISVKDGCFYFEGALGTVVAKTGSAKCEFAIERACLDVGCAANMAKVVKFFQRQQ